MPSSPIETGSHQSSHEKKQGILDAVAESLKNLLASEEFDKDISLFLERLGKAAGVSRVYIFENRSVGGVLHTGQIHEWTGDGVKSAGQHSEVRLLPWEGGGMDRWADMLSRQEIVCGLVKDFPSSEREILEPQDIKSVLAAPIFRKNHWWGFIGFDDCKTERRWTKTEMRVLKISGEILGSVILEKRLERELREKSEKFSLIFEHAPDGIYLIDYNGVFLDANKAALDFVGLTRDEAVGKNMANLGIMGKKDLLMASKALSMTLLGKNPGTEHYALKSRDGKDKKVEVRVYPVALGEKKAVLGIARDITKRENTEKKMKEARDFYNAIINNIADPVFVKDEEHRWVLLNDAFCSFMGHERKELLAKSDHDFFPKEEADVFWQKDDEVFASGGENINEEEFTDEDGVTHTISTKKTVYTNPNNEKFLVGVIRDLSDFKQAQKKLVERERMFRLLADNSVDCIWMMDKNLKFTYLSPALKDIAGYEPEEWVGTRLSEHFSKKEFLRVGAIAAKAVKEYSDFKPVCFETRMLDKRGKEIDVEITGSVLLDEDGKLKGLQGTTKDIKKRKKAVNELRESEEKFRKLIDNAPQALFLHDMQGNILDVNMASASQYGYSRRELLKLKAVDIDPDYAEREDEGRFWKELDEEGAKIFSARHTKKDGTEFPVEVRASPVQINGVKHVLALATDISEREKREAEREKLLRSLEERLKENKCLYEISNLAVQKNSMEEFLRETADTIPSGWSYPDETHAQILYEKKQFNSKGYVKGGEKQVRKILVDGLEIGRIKVNVNRKSGWPEGGVFLPEEDALLDSISRIVSESIEKRRREKALIESEERFRFLYESTPALNVIIGVDGVIRDANKTMLKTLGYAREEIVGKPAADYIPEENREEAQAHLEANFRGENPGEAILPILSKAGQARMLYFPQTRAGIIEKDGKPDAILLSGVDITEYRKSEDKLRENLKELERFQKLTVDRELKMIELKQRIRELEGEAVKK